ncbi:unnamed protein product [Caenorhabditis brenneri]
MRFVQFFVLSILLIIRNGLRADVPSLGTILALSTVDDTPCDNIKCFGQNECKMVDTFCLDMPPGQCPKQPLCSTVIYPK